MNPAPLRKRKFWPVTLLCILYALVMMELLFDRNVTPGWSEYRYNLVPFRTINNYIENYAYFNFNTWFKNLFGNIVLFIPIGIFAPLLRPGLFRFYRFFPAALTLLLIAETIQLVSKVGSFDVDDLILNMAGALIGWVFVRLNASGRHRIR